MNKIVEIFKAWGIAFNPNDSESELAAKRMEICDGCDFKRTSPIIYCSECDCALKVKIYSPAIGACPKDKWVDVEMEYFDKFNKNRYNQIKD